MVQLTFRPQKSTLVGLMQSHRQDAKDSKEPLLKKFHWEMAFTYLHDLRKYYGGDND